MALRGAGSVASDLLDLRSTAPADEENPWRSPREMIHHPVGFPMAQRWQDTRAMKAVVGEEAKKGWKNWVGSGLKYMFFSHMWLSWILVNINNI